MIPYVVAVLVFVLLGVILAHRFLPYDKPKDTYEIIQYGIDLIMILWLDSIIASGVWLFFVGLEDFSSQL